MSPRSPPPIAPPSPAEPPVKTPPRPERPATRRTGLCQVDREPCATQSRSTAKPFPRLSPRARSDRRCSSFLAPALTLPPFFALPSPPPQSDDTLEKVRTIISEQLGTDLDAVAADAKFVDFGAESLDTVEIMMALEEQFEITLDEEGAEKIATVQEAADMIEEQMA